MHVEYTVKNSRKKITFSITNLHIINTIIEYFEGENMLIYNIHSH